MSFYSEHLKRSAIVNLSDELKHELKLAIAYIKNEKLVPVIGMYAHDRAYKVIGVGIKKPITVKKYQNKTYPEMYYKVGYLKKLIA